MIGGCWCISTPGMSWSFVRVGEFQGTQRPPECGISAYLRTRCHKKLLCCWPHLAVCSEPKEDGKVRLAVVPGGAALVLGAQAARPAGHRHQPGGPGACAVDHTRSLNLNLCTASATHAALGVGGGYELQLRPQLSECRPSVYVPDPAPHLATRSRQVYWCHGVEEALRSYDPAQALADYRLVSTAPSMASCTAPWRSSSQHSPSPHLLPPSPRCCTGILRNPHVAPARCSYRPACCFCFLQSCTTPHCGP